MAAKHHAYLQAIIIPKTYLNSCTVKQTIEGKADRLYKVLKALFSKISSSDIEQIAGHQVLGVADC